MTFDDFLNLTEKPTNQTPSGFGFPLLFDSETELLDIVEGEFDSFDDLIDDFEIGSWDEFPTVFPNLKPIAVPDTEEFDYVDSYAEQLLLVDVSSPGNPVYVLSAEDVDWDEHDAGNIPFPKQADSFEEFFASLSDYVPED